MASIQARPQYNHHAPPHQGPYLPNGAVNLPPPGPFPGVAGLPPNTKVVEKHGVRILCIADVRGLLRTLNDLAKQANADYIIHTGDFGFYDASSLERIADKTLRHVAYYSPLLSEQQRKMIESPNPPNTTMKQRLQSMSNSQEPFILSELPLFLEKKYTLDVPVYTVWGACEDVRVLEKFRNGEYQIDKLHIIDEASSRLLDVGGVKLRLLGLGGAVVMHKLFDNGEGRTTIAGGQGTMWTTLLQMGELVDTANRVYDPSETRVFITHTSPAREGLLNQLSVTLKADFSISAGLHFRYGSSYNEFSVNPSFDYYRGKLSQSKASFNDVWETVKGEVQPAVANNQTQQTMLDNALAVVEKMPSNANGGNPFGGPPAGGVGNQGQADESAFKNMWNFNLADAAFGYLVLEVEGGKIGTEMRAQGFNFAHRTSKAQTVPQQASANSASIPTPTGAPSGAPSGPAAGVHGNTHTPGAVSPAVPIYSQPAAMRKGPAQNQPQPLHQQQQGPPQNAPVQPSPRPAVNEVSEPVKPATPLGPAKSPAPAVPLPPPVATDKPLPPQPSNGSAPATEQKATSPVLSPTNATAPDSHTGGRAQRPGLYITNLNSQDEVLALFSEDDRKLISNLQEKSSFNGKRKYFLMYLETQEIAQAVLGRVPSEYKVGDRNKAMVKLIDNEAWTDNRRNDNPRYGINDSKWGRGDNFAAKNDRGKSSASESESGPGGFNRGRGFNRGGKPRGGGPNNTAGFGSTGDNRRGGSGRGRGGPDGRRAGMRGGGDGSAPQTPTAE